MISGLRRRVEMLETQFSTDPVTLFMADGTMRTLRSGGKHFLRLCGELLSSDGAETHPELLWLRDCISIDGGEATDMFSLLQALCKGPNLQGEDESVLQLLEDKRGGQ